MSSDDEVQTTALANLFGYWSCKCDSSSIGHESVLSDRRGPHNMFAFFRRQKKQAGGNKKTKKQSGLELINEIQCVPVEKYEINFCNSFVAPYLKSESTNPTRPQQTMGNTGSSSKKSNVQSVDACYHPASVTFNKNVHKGVETKQCNTQDSSCDSVTTATQCAGEKLVEKTFLINDHAEGISQSVRKVQEPKTTIEVVNAPFTQQQTTNKFSADDKQTDVAAHEEKINNSSATQYSGHSEPTFSKEVSHDDANYQEDFGTAPSSPTSECINQSSVSGHEYIRSTARDVFFKPLKPARECDTLDEVEKRSDSNRVQQSDNLTSDVRKHVVEDSLNKSLCTSTVVSEMIMTEKTDIDLISTKEPSEFRDDICDQASILNTESLKKKNYSFDEFARLGDKIQTYQNNIIKINNAPAQCDSQGINIEIGTSENFERTDFSAEVLSRPSSKSVSDENSQIVRTKDKLVKNEQPNFCGKTQTISDLIPQNYTKIESLNNFHDQIHSDHLDSSISSTCSDEDDEFVEADSRQDEPNKLDTYEYRPPFHIFSFNNVKQAGIQIPDITITESSDSEGESDYEIEGYQNQCYERIYPSILYDITEVDEPFSDTSDVELCGFDDKRNVVHQETKFQEQIKILKNNLETKDSENMQLKGKINDLQRDIVNKTCSMDRLRAELTSFQTEADCVRKKLLKVEDDLTKYKNKNTELNEELLKMIGNENDNKRIRELQNEIEKLQLQIKELQKELELCKAEKEEYINKLAKLEKEKQGKIKTMEIALDETLKEKQKMQSCFNQEYEKLRTLNSEREQQLLNDFEWKLREVEMNCKRRIEEKKTNNEEKIQIMRKQFEQEIVQLKEQLKEVENMKSFQAEVSQLRGLTQEQDRSLKMAMKTTEQLQNNERALNEEIEKLRTSLEKERSHLATVQGIHSREISEKDRKYTFRMEQQKNEINSQWEDKVRRETIRLKLEMEKTYKDEKRNLLEEAKMKTEKQLKENNQMWEQKLLDNKREFENMQQKLADKEDSYRKELLRLQTNSDRDMLELRRKLDKMDLSYQEQLEKEQEQHEKELENLREEYEKRIQQSEQNWSQQISSTRATLELVKEQLQRETEAQLEALNKKYLLQLEQQYDRLMKEKEEAIIHVQEKCANEMCDLQNKLNEELKEQKLKETEMLKIIDQLKEDFNKKVHDADELQTRNDMLHNIICELQTKNTNYEKLTREAETALQKQEMEHVAVVSHMKDCYENEIKYWQEKMSSSQKEVFLVTEKSSEPITTGEESRTVIVPSQSKSSRRKGRGRHRNQKNFHNQHQLTQQFSSSSL